jgi:succinate dehydrogenase/fumarate reductase flavoprotein subunit
MHCIVVGGGLAGLVAALRAIELGARVTLLEKGDRLGGSFIFSSGYVWSYRDLQTFRRQVPGGEISLQRLILQRLEPSIEWLEERSLPALSRETGNPLTAGVRLDPKQTVAALSRRIAASGGRVLLSTSLIGLMQAPGGRIAGVRVSAGGEISGAEADAVILASGGFAANPELVGRHIIQGPGRMRLRAHPWSTGDGFLAALEAGGLASAGLDEFYGRNLPAPPAEFSADEFVEVSQLYGRYAVAINQYGERYADEAADWSETALVRATARQPGLRAWYVLDTAALQNRVRERTVEEMVATARRIGGPVLRARSLEELAGRIAGRGVPKANVLRTLDEYNAAAATGSELSPPRSAHAAPLQDPPYFAVEVAPTITHTVGGVAVDESCRVLRREDGRPLPGLFAAGVEVGGVSVGGYTSGLAAALVFGLVAPTSAVE